jgi:hypothetical protein
MGNTNREAIIESAGRIAVLRSEQQRIKQELKAAEAELDQLLKNSDTGQANQATKSDAILVGVIEPTEVSTSLNQRMIELLDASPNVDFSAEDVDRAYPGHNLTSIRSGLARLAEKNRIARGARGKYHSLHRASAGAA